MAEEILDLIYCYSKEEKVADQAFICHLANIAVKEMQVQGYIRKIILEKNKKGKTIASYIPSFDTIEINLKKAQANIQKLKDKKNITSSFEYYFFQNAFFCHFLFHELSHANDKKTVCSKKDSLEKTLIEPEPRFSEWKQLNSNFLKPFEPIIDSLQLTKENYLYKKFYLYLFTERRAEITSYTLLKDVMDIIKDEIKITNSTFNDLRIYSLLRGYQLEKSNSHIVCPTEIYLTGLNKKDVWTSLPFYDENKDSLLNKAKESFSLQERLTYGFPIDFSEYNNLEMESPSYQQLTKTKKR